MLDKSKKTVNKVSVSLSNSKKLYTLKVCKELIGTNYDKTNDTIR